MIQNYGWIQDPVAVKDTLKRLPHPLFCNSEAGLATAELATECFLWKAAEQVLGHQLPGRNQGQVGSCVSFGTASAIEHTMLCEIMAGDPEEFKNLCQESIYGGSRVEIGGGRISGDGSVGAWAAEFVNRYGCLSRGIYGPVDLNNYSEARCRDWGRNGVPDTIEPECRKHPVKTTSLVDSWDLAMKSLASGFGISVSSNQGFTMERDQDGFCLPKGQWGHCMALIGYQNGSRPGGFLLNSWGDDAHTGPRGAGNAPLAGFWADAKVIHRMLQENDSWAFSGVQGFPMRRVRWYL